MLSIMKCTVWHYTCNYTCNPPTYLCVVSYSVWNFTIAEPRPCRWLNPAPSVPRSSPAPCDVYRQDHHLRDHWLLVSMMSDRKGPCSTQNAKRNEPRKSLSCLEIYDSWSTSYIAAREDLSSIWKLFFQIKKRANYGIISMIYYIFSNTFRFMDSRQSKQSTPPPPKKKKSQTLRKGLAVVLSTSLGV